MIVEQASRDHRLRPLDDLLGGLEDEQVLAADVPDPVDQRARDSEHDRHVGVVAARVHAAVDAGVKIDPGLFVNRQRVDVGAKHHRLAGPAGVEQRDSACLGRACLEVQPELTQPFFEVSRGLVLAEADLWMLVEVAPLVDHVIEHRLARQRSLWIAFSHGA